MLELLMVEDNPADVRLALEALKYAEAPGMLSVVEDGVEALAFLRKEGAYAGVPRPDLILLDLNLPRKDGREVLAEVKSDQELRRIPVIILTTSQAEEDVLAAYNLCANCYVTKPIDLDRFIEVMRFIGEFWMETATLPAW